MVKAMDDIPAYRSLADLSTVLMISELDNRPGFIVDPLSFQARYIDVDRGFPVVLAPTDYHRITFHSYYHEECDCKKCTPQFVSLIQCTADCRACSRIYDLW